MSVVDHEITSNPDLSRGTARYSSMPPSMTPPNHPYGYLSSPYSGYEADDYDPMAFPTLNGLLRPGSEPPLGSVFDGADSPVSHTGAQLSYYRSPRSTAEPLTPATLLNGEVSFGDLGLPNGGCDANQEPNLDIDRLYTWPATSC
jgi:hypothetical protein